MVLHDLRCSKCDDLFYDILCNPKKLGKCTCGGQLEIEWHTPRVGQLVAVHSRERTVVWQHPKTGKVAYPPVNNADMPARYKNNGYKRVEMTNLKQLDKFCAEKKLINETASFDRSGHADDL